MLARINYKIAINWGRSFSTFIKIRKKHLDIKNKNAVAEAMSNMRTVAKLKADQD